MGLGRFRSLPYQTIQVFSVSSTKCCDRLDLTDPAYAYPVASSDQDLTQDWIGCGVCNWILVSLEAKSCESTQAELEIVYSYSLFYAWRILLNWARNWRRTYHVRVSSYNAIGCIVFLTTCIGNGVTSEILMICEISIALISSCLPSIFTLVKHVV